MAQHFAVTCDGTFGIAVHWLLSVANLSSNFSNLAR